MTTYATGNPIGSTAVKDLSDNAENLDVAVNSRTSQNWIDRLGAVRWTYFGMEQQFNLFLANSNFEPSVPYAAGLSMTRPTQTVSQGGQIYRPRVDSIPFTTTGVFATDAAKFTLVGDSSLRTDLAASTGATLVKNGNRSVAAQLNDTTRLEDQLPAGNGSADDLGPVNSAIAASSDGIVVTENKNYRVSARPTALNGVRYQGRGAIMLDTPLGPRQLNTYGDDLRIHRGREYLARIFIRLTEKGQVKIDLRGDSTIAGGNGEPFEYGIAPWLTQAFADKGYSNVVIQNNAVGGTRIQDMNALGALGPTLDGMVIGYGTNNAARTQAAVDFYLSTMDSKIAEIRAQPYGTFQNLAIIIMGPNATNDIPNQRDYWFYEKIHWGLVELSKKHQCGYYNRYGECPDADNMAGGFLDASPLVDSGVGIHLMPAGISTLWGSFMEWAFPNASMTIFKTNAFSNNGSASGIPLAATPGTSYRQGRHIFRVNPTNGWPDDGMVDVLVNPDGVIVQRLTTFGVRHKEYTRSWVILGGIWTAWTGVAFPLVLGNSWLDFGSSLPPATVTLLGDGIHAYVTFAIKGGVTTVGAAFAQIPSQLAPKYVDLFDAKVSGGASCEIRMLTDGTLQFETAGNATLTKGSFTYRVAD